MLSRGITELVEDVYLPSEIARAAGVPLEQVVAAVGGADVFVGHGAAIRLGRRLAGLAGPAGTRLHPLFTPFYASPPRHHVRLPLVVAGAVHVCLFAVAVALAAAGRLSPTSVLPHGRVGIDDNVRLVFVAEPGPGGGGGGGGLKGRDAPTRAEARGSRRIGNPIARRPSVPLEPPTAQPVLASEPFPVVVAPLAPPSAGARNHVGLEDIAGRDETVHGPGSEGGTGTGAGAGIGAGRGLGLGDGTGGGTGGGVFGAGSGIEPPRVIREVKADYPDEARRQGIEGEVVVALVVRRDGSVADARVVRRLSAALDQRALQAVRQWRFEPGKQRGSPVDVAVEVVVEFRLR